MGEILTNNKYYKDIADTIRQMKGVNIVYKPREMAGALRDMYSTEVEGALPLIFQSNGNNLLNYKIYGTSDGVGDRTSNLFDITTIVEKKYINNEGDELSSTSSYNENFLNHSDYIQVVPSQNYTFACYLKEKKSLNNTIAMCWFDINKNIINRNTLNIGRNTNFYSITATSPANAVYLIVNFIGYVDDVNFMCNTGSTALPYEPYGYKIPVVVNGKNIYDENSELNTNGTIDLASGMFPDSTGGYKRTFFFKAKPNTTYTFSCDTIGDRLVICEYNTIINPSDYSTSNRLTPNKKILSQSSGVSEYSFTTSSTTKMVGIYYSLDTLPTNIQIEFGDTATPYEEHTDIQTNIYLNEQIEANESILMKEANVNIPTINGTNILSIDTTVQPSNVYVQAPKTNNYNL